MVNAKNTDQTNEGCACLIEHQQRSAKLARSGFSVEERDQARQGSDPKASDATPCEELTERVLTRDLDDHPNNEDNRPEDLSKQSLSQYCAMQNHLSESEGEQQLTQLPLRPKRSAVKA